MTFQLNRNSKAVSPSKISAPDLSNDDPIGLDAYSVGPVIGIGQFGKVFRAVHTPTCKPVALKLIPLIGRSRDELMALRAEIACHSSLVHKNIVRCMDCLQTPDGKEVAVITELCPKGDLWNALKRRKRFLEAEIHPWAIGLVEGLRFLHLEHKIIHRDLKLQNILIGADGEARICDFGFAKLLDNQKLTLTSIKGTPVYMAPEIIKEQPYTHKVDIWALGVMLYELFVGTPPFYAPTIMALIEIILTSKVTYTAKMSKTFQDLLESILRKNEADRIDWPDLASHPFIQNGPSMPNHKRPMTTDSGVEMAHLLEIPEKSVSNLSISSGELQNSTNIFGGNQASPVRPSHSSASSLRSKPPSLTRDMLYLGDAINWPTVLTLTEHPTTLVQLCSTVELLDILTQGAAASSTLISADSHIIIPPSLALMVQALERIVVFLASSLLAHMDEIIRLLRNLVSWSTNQIRLIITRSSVNVVREQRDFLGLLLDFLGALLKSTNDIHGAVTNGKHNQSTSYTASPADQMASTLCQNFLPIIPKLLELCGMDVHLLRRASNPITQLFGMFHRVKTSSSSSECWEDTVNLGVTKVFRKQLVFLGVNKENQLLESNRRIGVLAIVYCLGAAVCHDLGGNSLQTHNSKRFINELVDQLMLTREGITAVGLTILADFACCDSFEIMALRLLKSLTDSSDKVHRWISNRPLVLSFIARRSLEPTSSIEARNYAASLLKIAVHSQEKITRVHLGNHLKQWVKQLQQQRLRVWKQASVRSAVTVLYLVTAIQDWNAADTESATELRTTLQSLLDYALSSYEDPQWQILLCDLVPVLGLLGQRRMLQEFCPLPDSSWIMLLSRFENIILSPDSVRNMDSFELILCLLQISQALLERETSIQLQLVALPNRQSFLQLILSPEVISHHIAQGSKQSAKLSHCFSCLWSIWSSLFNTQEDEFHRDVVSWTVSELVPPTVALMLIFSTDELKSILRVIAAACLKDPMIRASITSSFSLLYKLSQSSFEQLVSRILRLEEEHLPVEAGLVIMLCYFESKQTTADERKVFKQALFERSLLEHLDRSENSTIATFCKRAKAALI